MLQQPAPLPRFLRDRDRTCTIKVFLANDIPVPPPDQPLTSDHEDTSGAAAVHLHWRFWSGKCSTQYGSRYVPADTYLGSALCRDTFFSTSTMVPPRSASRAPNPGLLGC